MTLFSRWVRRRRIGPAATELAEEILAFVLDREEEIGNVYEEIHSERPSPSSRFGTILSLEAVAINLASFATEFLDEADSGYFVRKLALMLQTRTGLLHNLGSEGRKYRSWWQKEVQLRIEKFESTAYTIPPLADPDAFSGSPDSVVEVLARLLLFSVWPEMADYAQRSEDDLAEQERVTADRASTFAIESSMSAVYELQKMMAVKLRENGFKPLGKIQGLDEDGELVGLHTFEKLRQRRRLSD